MIVNDGPLALVLLFLDYYIYTFSDFDVSVISLIYLTVSTTYFQVDLQVDEFHQKLKFIRG